MSGEPAGAEPATEVPAGAAPPGTATTMTDAGAAPPGTATTMTDGGTPGVVVSAGPDGVVVASPASAATAAATTGAGGGRWRVPRTWRVLLALARAVVAPVARLRVTGTIPEALRAGPIIFAVNHVGPFDPVAVTAACGVAGLAPRLMATGGLFRAPVVGNVMRAAGHIRINRRQANVAAAVDDVTAALAVGSHVLGYPEGRITLDPGMWPERGKTGLARVALATGAPVVAVAQWGAHEVAAWGGVGPTIRTLARSFIRRPVVRVHFGAVVDLSGIQPGAVGAAQRATDRIIDAITAELRPLRSDEPRLPRYVDPVRPLSTQRRHRPAT